MRQYLLSLCVLAGCSTLAHAQPVEPGTTRLAFEVWNGSSWGNATSLFPGARIEYRITVSYTGTQNVHGLASGRYQPTFSNIDNDGASRDANAPFRNGGVSGNASGGVLNVWEGPQSDPLASYGRVGFAATAMNSSSLNILTEHRHGGGSPQAGAPAGSWLRLAGSSVTNWPLATLNAAQATGTNLNNIARGIPLTQTPAINAASGAINTFYIAGTQNLVVFRGALILSDSIDLRIITLSNAEGSALRVGGLNNADDTRYFDWHTSVVGGSLRSSVVVSEAIIGIIPSPSTASLAMMAAGVFATRRRRSRRDLIRSKVAQFV
ncbi:MAG: hypothetical protein ACK5P8_02330 [Phycisphaerae bacterium]|jgi:hypothetical protein